MAARLIRLLASVAAALSLLSLPFTAGADEELFNGRDLSGWDTWLGVPEVPRLPIELWSEWPDPIGLNRDELGVFSVVEEDGEPAIRISGETWGALISASEYTDYHLQLQFKWGAERYVPRADKPRNTGLLYHSTGSHGAFWSYWMRSVEFEIMEGHTGDFTSVDGVGGEIRTEWDFNVPYPWQRYSAAGDTSTVGGMVFRVSGSADHELAHGRWNTLDLYVYGNRAKHRVNGHTVMLIDNLHHQVDGKSAPLRSGKIQLQSEGAEVFFRRLRLRPITSLPAESSF